MSLKSFREKHKNAWQVIMFIAVSGIATVIDFVSFAVFNYFVFKNLSSVPFELWLFKYGVENGGLCAFLSFAASFFISQTANFFIQRKATFSASNNVVKSAVMYAIMVIAVYVFILWLPTVIGAPVYAALGAGLGAAALKVISSFLSACIQFPINKFVIMRH